MTIRPTNKRVVEVHNETDNTIVTVIPSYSGYDTLKPCYTLIEESPLGTAPLVLSNKSAEWVNEYFNSDIIVFFDED